MSIRKKATLVGLGIVILLAAGAAAYLGPRYGVSLGTYWNKYVNTYTATSTANATSAVSTSSSPKGAPIAITSADVSAHETQASLSGTVRPNGLYTSYWFEYGTTTSLGSRSAVQNLGSGYQTLTAPGYLQSLTRNTKYYYRLVAQNEAGKTSGTTYTFTTMSSSSTSGGLPTVKTTEADDITGTGALVYGDINPNQAETKYWFEYGKTTDLGQLSAIKSAGDGKSKRTVSAALIGLDPGVTYYYRLNAQNQFGTANGSVMSFRTSGSAARAAPSVKTTEARDVDTISATAQGTVNPNGLETTYWFEYSTDALLSSALLTSTERTSIGSGAANVNVQAQIRELVSNTTYYYRLVAQNTIGTTYGDKMTFKTK